ncbi:hypothetical protein HDK77DRAFT_77098 [Phyllosticta capitalensis]
MGNPPPPHGLSQCSTGISRLLLLLALLCIHMSTVVGKASIGRTRLRRIDDGAERNLSTVLPVFLHAGRQTTHLLVAAWNSHHCPCVQVKAAEWRSLAWREALLLKLSRLALWTNRLPCAVVCFTQRRTFLTKAKCNFGYSSERTAEREARRHAREVIASTPNCKTRIWKTAP